MTFEQGCEGGEGPEHMGVWGQAFQAGGAMSIGSLNRRRPVWPKWSEEGQSERR